MKRWVQPTSRADRDEFYRLKSELKVLRGKQQRVHIKVRVADIEARLDQLALNPEFAAGSPNVSEDSAKPTTKNLLALCSRAKAREKGRAATRNARKPWTRCTSTHARRPRARESFVRSDARTLF